MSGLVGLRSVFARFVAGASARLGVPARELACLAGILAVAAATRFADLPARGGWDSDQGTEMLAMRNAITGGGLPTFGPLAISVGGSFHHGALYYDLLLPAAWLGNGDPTFVVAEIALLSLLVVPIVWWIARSIGGPAAGLIAACLAAVSASLIGYATFIWNPTLVEPAAAVAFLGAWEGWRTGRPQWWLVAAAGSAVAMQSHVAAGVIVVPMAAAFLAALRRAPAGRRRRVAAWGAAAVALVALSYLPVIAHELSHDFPETRGMIGYFTGPDSTPARDPLTRLLFSAIRILAWPLIRWPLVDLKPSFLPSLAVAVTLALTLAWRVARTGSPAPDAEASTGTPASATAAAEPAAREPAAAGRAAEHEGLRFVGGMLLLIVVALGLGLKAVSEVQELPTEQYHVVADPLVFVAAGLALAGIWRAAGGGCARQVGRVAAVAAVAGLVAWNVGHWPPLTSPDGGWPAAQAAATRIERIAAGAPVALVPLFEEKGGDAYAYPLQRDGTILVAVDRANVVAVLCDTFWLKGCSGEAEGAWLATQPGGLTQVDRFAAAPDRIVTVYRRSP
ncbi:MAG: glycosyltransferase family 39 protein [Candidatus Limnocylindrales bacterium]|jgi:hypothetical protein